MRRLVLVAVLAGCAGRYGGGRPVQPTDLDASWLRAAPTPVVQQQHESDCGLAALAMIAGSWGQIWDLAQLERSVASTGGIRLGTLRDLARGRGLDAYAIAGTSDDLRHELTSGRPVLVGLVMPKDRSHARSHYEVAIAMRPRDGSVVTLDPASGKWLERSRALFDAEWKAGGYPALLVLGMTSPRADRH